MKKNDLSFIFLMILSLSVGYVFGSITAINNIQITQKLNNEKVVTISSIRDNQEVHSVVVIDAIISSGDKVEVYINNELKADYVPFYWNNIDEPVGNYSIVVRIYDSEGNIIGNDTKTVIIPDRFEVPHDYKFKEDFVVHEGQEVIFRDFDYSLNSFGNITIINASITAEWLIFEKHSQTVLMNESTLRGLGFGTYNGYNFNSLEIHGIRFNDHAKLYIYNEASNYHQTYNSLYYEELTDEKNWAKFAIIYPETYQFL